MKTKIFFPAVLLILAGMSFARLSLPNNFYYGEAKGVGGFSLTGEPNAKVIARFNEKICAETYIGGFITNRVNYILRVPIDDGWDVRFAEYAPREGELIDIFICYDDVEFSVDDFIPPVGPAETSYETAIPATPEPVSIYYLLFIIYYYKIRPLIQ